jgi:hypothetical protein
MILFFQVTPLLVFCESQAPANFPGREHALQTREDCGSWGLGVQKSCVLVHGLPFIRQGFQPSLLTSLSLGFLHVKQTWQWCWLLGQWCGWRAHHRAHGDPEWPWGALQMYSGDTCIFKRLKIWYRVHLQINASQILYIKSWKTESEPSKQWSFLGSHVHVELNPN